MPQQIGPYTIEGELGRGGMGVVYRAKDPRLDRDVAIKALPEDFASDPSRLERFEREAKTLAQVTSQHIAGIYGVEEGTGEQAGQKFLVLELVEGETLADRLDRGPIEPDEALEFADQIAAGVEAAHEAGVIHRDLKPANIRVTPEGRVKVLDFGLARTDEGQTSSGFGSSQLVTATTPQQHTTPGAVLGTAAYMSPEQARGRRVDKRTDIWAFGVVLYEMLAGASPFAGETATDSIGAVLHKDLDLDRLPPSVTPGVKRVLTRCLERDKNLRYRDIGDVRIELRRAATEPVVEAAPAKRGVAPAVAVLLALVLAGAGLAAGWFAKTAPEPRELRVSVAAPEGARVGVPLLSPGGERVIAVSWAPGSRSRFLYRNLDDFEWTEPTQLRGIQNYNFSPDGDAVAIIAAPDERSRSNQLFVYQMGSELPPTPIVTLPESVEISSYEFQWLGRDAAGQDRLVFADERINQIRLVNVDTASLSEPIPVDAGEYNGTLGSIHYRLDASRVLCEAFRYTSTSYVVDLCVIDVDAQTITPIVENASEGSIGPDGSLLFTRGETLYGAAFNTETLEVGRAVQLLSGLRTNAGLNDAPFSIARDGTLAFRPGGAQGGERHLSFIMPEGEIENWSPQPSAFIQQLSVNDDLSRLLVTVAGQNRLWEIWGSEIDDPRLRRVRAPSGKDVNYPVFAPDGDAFAYMFVNPQGPSTRVEVASFDGLFEPQPITADFDGVLAPLQIHPDGDRVLILRESNEGSRLYEAPIDGSGDAERLFSFESNQNWGNYSPDGSMIAYTSDETGRQEAYVRSVRGAGSFGRAVPVTSGGGFWTRWQRDDDGAGPFTLFVGTPGQRYTTYEITPGDRPAVGEPAYPTYESERISTARREFLADGRIFTITEGANETEPTRVELILNWYDKASELIRGE